jgi:NAD(P)-dependent dehydrogenase (short-subunit alcohol dehydrogenase family)
MARREPRTEKVCLVTGATGGIGAAIAHRLAADGATVITTGRDRERGTALADHLRRSNAHTEFLAADLRDDDAITGLARHIADHYGRLDALILNAGVITFGNTCELATADFDDMIAVNVRAPWMCARTFAPILADGATVVVTASVSSFTHFPGEGVYCMTKAALIPLVHALVLEWAPRRIRVNALCPGIVAEHGMSHDALAASADPAAEQDRNDALTPLRRAASLQEIAAGAAYLCSDDSSFMTGQSLVIDGGLTIPRV